MNRATLNLVVIRAKNIETTRAFYEVLGLTFTKHAHGQGPEHYASEENGMVFEIYPTQETGVTSATRLGFKVKQLDALLLQLLGKNGQTVSPAQDSPWGRRAVVLDPAGYKVELLESGA